MSHYSHTQSTVAWVLVAAVAETVVIVSAIVAGLPVMGLVAVLAATSVLALVAVVFSRLTVEVHDEGVTVWFGSGWPRRSIPFSQIVAAHKVRNPVWVGWGLRWIRRGTVWNVWGRDAVELTLDRGRAWRLGTDQPDDLLAALGGRVPTA